MSEFASDFCRNSAKATFIFHFGMHALLLPAIFMLSAVDQVRCAPAVSVRSAYSSLPAVEKVKFDLFQRKEQFNRDRMASNLRSLTRDQISELYDKAIVKGRPRPIDALLSFNYEDAQELACEALGRALFGYHSHQSAQYLVTLQPQARKITPECFRSQYDRAFEASNLNAIKALMHYAAPVTFDLQDVYDLFEKIIAANNARFNLADFISTDGLITPEKVRAVYQMAVEQENYALIAALLSTKKNNQYVIASEAALNLFERTVVDGTGNAPALEKQKIFGRILMDAMNARDMSRVAHLLAQYGPTLTNGQLVASLLRETLDRKQFTVLRLILHAVPPNVIGGLDRELLGDCLVESAINDDMDSVNLILGSPGIRRTVIADAFGSSHSESMMRRFLNPLPADQSKLMAYDGNMLLEWVQSKQMALHVQVLADRSNYVTPTQGYIQNNPGVSKRRLNVR